MLFTGRASSCKCRKHSRPCQVASLKRLTSGFNDHRLGKQRAHRFREKGIGLTGKRREVCFLSSLDASVRETSSLPSILQAWIQSTRRPELRRETPLLCCWVWPRTLSQIGKRLGSQRERLVKRQGVILDLQTCSTLAASSSLKNSLPKQGLSLARCPVTTGPRRE